MQIRHFRRFRQNGPFLAGDKNTVYQKHGLRHPGRRGVAKGSSTSWDAKLKGDTKLSNWWSRSCMEVNLLLSAGK